MKTQLPTADLDDLLTAKTSARPPGRSMFATARATSLTQRLVFVVSVLLAVSLGTVLAVALYEIRAAAELAETLRLKESVTQVAALLEAGANPKAKNKSASTPLKLAKLIAGRGGSGSPEAKAEQAEILRLLKKHGA